MIKFAYIGFPITIGTILLICLIYVFVKLPQRNAQINLSFGIAWLQLVFAWMSNLFTMNDNISSEACLTGIFGFYISSAIMICDTLNLAFWLTKKWKHKEVADFTFPITFVVVRMGTHLAFGAAFLWSAKLCTV